MDSDLLNLIQSIHKLLVTYQQSQDEKISLYKNNHDYFLKSPICQKLIIELNSIKKEKAELEFKLNTLEKYKTENIELVIDELKPIHINADVNDDKCDSCCNNCEKKFYNKDELKKDEETDNLYSIYNGSSLNQGDICYTCLYTLKELLLQIQIHNRMNEYESTSVSASETEEEARNKCKRKRSRRSRRRRNKCKRSRRSARKQKTAFRSRNKAEVVES